MENTQQLKESGLIPEEALTELYNSRFELYSEDIEGEEYIDFERYTDIDEDSNYTERISFVVSSKTFYASLSIHSDYIANEEDFGSSMNYTQLDDAVKWLDDTRAQ